MMRVKTFVLIGGALLFSLLAGCMSYDGRPVVARYNPPDEYKLKSITHWNIIAEDVATQIQTKLQQSDQVRGCQIFCVNGVRLLLRHSFLKLNTKLI